MTTVIAVYSARGCVGRCDANCHEARVKKCTCICGGRNHGMGLDGAQANTLRLIGLNAADLKRFADAHGRNPKDLTVIDRLKTPNARHARIQAREKILQPDLFEELELKQ